MIDGSKTTTNTFRKNGRSQQVLHLKKQPNTGPRTPSTLSGDLILGKVLGKDYENFGRRCCYIDGDYAQSATLKWDNFHIQWNGKSIDFTKS